MNASMTKSIFAVNADLKFIQRTKHVCIDLNGTPFDPVEFLHVVAIETADSINSYELFSNNNNKKNRNDDRFIYVFAWSHNDGHININTNTNTQNTTWHIQKVKEFPFRSTSKIVKTSKVDILFSRFFLNLFFFFLLNSL